MKGKWLDNRGRDTCELETAEDQIQLMEEFLSGDSGMSAEGVHEACEILSRFVRNAAIDEVLAMLDQKIHAYYYSIKETADRQAKIDFSLERSGVQLARAKISGMKR